LLILAVDSATPVAGVALINEDKLIREDFVNYKKTHSETLMPMINKVLSDCDCSIQDVSALAVTTGPGSFTGLRIGLATIKGLCLSSGKPVIGISTLDVIAHNIAYSEALVCPLLDARKQEVYTAIYDVSGLIPVRLTEEVACSPREFVDMTRSAASQYGRNGLFFWEMVIIPTRTFSKRKWVIDCSMRRII
jgi:tRNA threonylcarbamoyladenosine biosynthesis protein TsaB